MDTILIILRVLINDVSETLYEDIDLNRIIIVAAGLVKQEISLDVTYTIDYTLLSISPDPTEEAFINFTALKAAIILLRGELKDISSNTFKIVDGPSTIDTTMRYSSSKNLLESLLEQYDLDKINYSMNNSIGGYRAVITTPTTEDRI
jgi:hypothetical protein